MISATATYYAVPDPTNPSAMTYWRRDRRGRLAPRRVRPSRHDEKGLGR